ncbi:EEF1A lysine methyltransferase 3-like [Scyliorhinus torazame]|uniref:EEF1A lysine methyltransferase 3-like n=1 Tax=Scyliorhinus torazame TaxID=75743 RepID=UPI003B5A54AB
MAKLMEKASWQRIKEDDDFTWKEFYQTCGFHLEIGVNPLSRLGFGTTVWGAALGLCQYFEKERIQFSDKKVIELGAGTGIVSILVALLGGDVTITDKPEILKQIERNVSFNVAPSFKHRVKVRSLRWGRDHHLFPSDYDYILGSDIVTFHQDVPFILESLLHLSNEKTIVYFASTMYYNQQSISEGHLTLSQYFETELVCRYEAKDVNVYKMFRKL